MENKPSKSPSYLPHIVIFTVLYFVAAIAFCLLSLKLTILNSILSSVFVYLLLTGFYFIADKSYKKKTDTELKDKQQESQTQNSFRKEAWIEGLRREAKKKQDSIFRGGQVIAIGIVLFWFIVRAISPKLVTFQAIFLLSPWLVAIIWFLILALFSRSTAYFLFIVMAIVRVAMLAFGPNILQMLPQFLMLPIFYLLMMFFMYGSIMLPNIAQIKFHRPGEGDWEVPDGATRGQFQARSMVETQMDRLVRYAEGKSDRKPATGMIFKGPPGVGKTLLAKEKATKLQLPTIIADGQAFNAPFMGFAPLLVGWIRGRVEKLAREFGGAFFFIDEGETLFGARSGMQQPSQYTREADLYDVLDPNGMFSFDAPHVRYRNWYEAGLLASQKTPQPEGKHSVFMMPGGGGGGNTAIYPFLTWMSGAQSAPLMKRTGISIANALLNSFCIPVTAFGKVLRFAPAKAHDHNIMFITATNRPWMIDPAMLRPGRFSIEVEFVIPDEDERADTAKYYLELWHKKGYYQDYMITPERIREFAQATPNASQAEIEQMIAEAVDVRVQFLAELRRVKRYADEGKLDTLLERDRKFWSRFKSLIYDNMGKEIAGWDDEGVNWQALMETKSAISYGRANPDAVNETTKRKGAFHELGHFIALKVFNGTRIKPTLLTVIPRQGSLGMVAHIPNDTREQNSHEFYMGLIRTSLASWVTEHFFFGQNMPGVSGDLRNATNIACLMIGKWGMPPFSATEKEREYYYNIGKKIMISPETNMFNPMATAAIESVLRSPEEKRQVAILLGKAAVDDYRLIRKNKAIYLEVIPEFLAFDEFSGNRLSDLWNSLDSKLVTLSKMTKKEQGAKPKNAFDVIDASYVDVKPEGKDILDQINAKIGGVA